MLPADVVLGQGQTRHGEHREPVVAHLGVRVGTLLRDEQRHALAHLVEEIGDDDRVLTVLRGIPAQHVEDLPRVRVRAPTHRSDCTQQHDAGLRHPGHLEGKHPGERIKHQPAPGGGGQRLFPPPGPIRVVLVKEMRQLRLSDHPIGVENAGLGVEQVDRPGVGPKLG